MDTKTNLSLRMKNDPVLNGLSTLFEDLQNKIEVSGVDKFASLKEIFGSRNRPTSGSAT